MHAGWVTTRAAAGEREQKNTIDTFYDPANFDLKGRTPDHELVEVALLMHHDSEACGFGPEEVRRVARVLTRLAESRAGGRN